MVRVDITCDLMDEDETGYVWAFLRDARDQALIQPGAGAARGLPGSDPASGYTGLTVLFFAEHCLRPLSLEQLPANPTDTTAVAMPPR